MAGTAALLAPKCPLCLAAYLSLFGVTLEAASVVAPLLRPLGLVLLVLALGVLIRRYAARLSRRRSAIEPKA
ncbi:hypothetical protein [Vulgatibacter incomptus]|uniref:hypothetical protein n=1 Tax=Vulgatibacter incomptus TaxID=1391653 RepID=UPI00067FCB97|nr:hypothetical protein [Vulgatibacter incomptus]